MTQPTLGKIKNIDAGGELKFSMNPVDFRLTKNYDFVVEACLGQNSPLVAFRSGGLAQLACELIFDRDADKDANLKTVRSFLDSLNVVKEDSRSVPQVEFSLGSFNFKGYVNQFVFQPFRFDADGEIVAAKVSLTLISSGEYENAKSK